MSFQKMYGFEGLGLLEVQLSISELSVVEVGGPDKRTSWSDLVGVRQKCVILWFFPLYLSSQEHIWSLVLGCWKSTKDQLLMIIIGAFSPRSRPSTEKSVKRLFYHDRYGMNAIFQLFIPRSRVLSRVLPSLFNINSTEACTN